jgi:hypothetical protein
MPLEASRSAETLPGWLWGAREMAASGTGSLAFGGAGAATKFGDPLPVMTPTYRA